MRDLEADERETSIVFDETQNPAVVLTYNKTWQKHFEQRLGIEGKDVGMGGMEYLIDKHRIKPPRAPLKLTAKAREDRAARIRGISKKTQTPLSKKEAKKQT